MRSVTKSLIIICLLVLGAASTFVSQLYSPIILWIISFSLLAGSIALGLFVDRRSIRLVLALVFALIINGNFLLHIPFGNPVIVMVFYGVSLALITWALLFSIAELTASMRPQRHQALTGED